MKTKELGIYTKRDDYYVTVSVQKQGQIYNYLEDCYYDLDEERCFVIEGTVKEKWPVSFEALEKTYQIDDKIMKELSDGNSVRIHPKKNTAKLMCYEALEESIVKTSYGDDLTAHKGDIIGYRLDEHGKYKPDHGRVINKDVFMNTYRPLRLNEGSQPPVTIHRCLSDKMQKFIFMDIIDSSYTFATLSLAYV